MLNASFGSGSQVPPLCRLRFTARGVNPENVLIFKVSMSVISQIIPLERRDKSWRTLDPFLSFVHHQDHYPPGNKDLAPSSKTRKSRFLDDGSCGKDGATWSMYEGSHVPGFPKHPHRGFESITFVRNGLIDHSDSLGSAARYSPRSSVSL